MNEHLPMNAIHPDEHFDLPSFRTERAATNTYDFTARAELHSAQPGLTRSG